MGTEDVGWLLHNGGTGRQVLCPCLSLQSEAQALGHSLSRTQMSSRNMSPYLRLSVGKTYAPWPRRSTLEFGLATSPVHTCLIIKGFSALLDRAMGTRKRDAGNPTWQTQDQVLYPWSYVPLVWPADTQVTQPIRGPQWRGV